MKSKNGAMSRTACLLLTILNDLICFAVKEEVPEKRFEVENRSFIGTPIDKAAADGNVCNPNCNGIDSSSGIGDGEENMSPPKLTPAIPRLRVRRFSGDILSGNCGGRRPSTELMSTFIHLFSLSLSLSHTRMHARFQFYLVPILFPQAEANKVRWNVRFPSYRMKNMPAKLCLWLSRM